MRAIGRASDRPVRRRRSRRRRRRRAPAPTPSPGHAAQRPRAAAATATAVLTVTVNDPTGAPLAEVKVTAIGPVEREGETTVGGQARMLGIRAGTYRLRFEKEGFYTFEKEVSWRAGTPAPSAEATLNAGAAASAAARRRPKPEPPKPVAVPDCRPASRRTVECPTTSRRNHITNKEPHKENLIGCSGGAQTWLWQVRDRGRTGQHESRRADALRRRRRRARWR